MTQVIENLGAFTHWALDERRGSYGVALMRMGFGAMTIALILMFLPDMSYSFGEGSRWGEVYYRTSFTDDYLSPISELFSRADSDAVTLVKVFVLLVVAALYTLGVDGCASSRRCSWCACSASPRRTRSCSPRATTRRSA